jgi:8-amino-7-oxononanoate synthase
VYTTALPAAACAAAEAAVDIVEDEPQRRQKLAESSVWLRRQLREKLGLETGGSCSQIVPVMLGSAQRAVAASEALLDRGYWVPAIRPPTVPADGSRLRVSVTALHSRGDLAGLVGALDEVVGKT